MVIVSDLSEVQPCLLIRSLLIKKKNQTNKPESQPQTISRTTQLPSKQNSFGNTEAHQLQERFYLHSCSA